MIYTILLNMSTYADIVKHSPEIQTYESKNEFMSWESVKHMIHRELYLQSLVKSPIDKMYFAKMDVILEENGFALFSKLKELQEYYDLQGFLDDINMSSFAKMLHKHIELEEPSDVEENDPETFSDWDDN